MDMFSLNNVNLVYDLGKEEVTHALRNVSLKFDSKGLTGIIGPSGSGKSSMLYLMAGLKNPTSGEVDYRGKSFSKMGIDARAGIRKREFGFIFQRGYLIEYLSVLDNVLVPINSSSGASRMKAIKILEMLGIEKLAGKKPYQLSGGQRQRTAIARALVNDPEVVFADEPTAALDHKSAMEVMKILNDYSREKLVIVVTHDKSILTGAAKVISIWDGVVRQLDTDESRNGFEGQVDAL